MRILGANDRKLCRSVRCVTSPYGWIIKPNPLDFGNLEDYPARHVRI